MISLAEARDRTPSSVARWILTRILVANDLFHKMRWVEPNSQNVHTYSRTLGELAESWTAPGQPVPATSKVATENLSVELRQSLHKFSMADYFRILASGGGDQGQQQIEAALVEIGKIVGRRVVAGQGIDTITIDSGASLTAAHLGTITPGPMYKLAAGPGTIKYSNADGTLRYRAQGDSDYGAPVALSVGVATTLRSRRPSYWVKLTPAANPGVDAVAELIYSSTRLQPDGLISQIDPSQVIPVTDSVNGDAFDFSQMDDLVVQLGGLWDPADCAWIMHGSTESKLLSKARQTVMSLDDVMLSEGDVKRKAKGYRGAPILRNDFLPGTPVANSKIAYPIILANLNPNYGFVGVCPGVTGAQTMDNTGFSGQILGEGSQVMQVSGKPVMGYRVKALGAARDSDGDETMVTWYGASALQALQGAASRDGVR